MRDREREREAETQEEREAGSPQGARRGTRSWDHALGRRLRSTAEPPGLSIPLPISEGIMHIPKDHKPWGSRGSLSEWRGRCVASVYKFPPDSRFGGSAL